MRRAAPAVENERCFGSSRAAHDLKAAGKVPEGMRKADVARLLAAEMEKAAKAGRVRHALKARYIANQMSAWGIWPVSSIK